VNIAASPRERESGNLAFATMVKQTERDVLGVLRYDRDIGAVVEERDTERFRHSGTDGVCPGHC
jgi:hypothetical protein